MQGACASCLVRPQIPMLEAIQATSASNAAAPVYTNCTTCKHTCVHLDCTPTGPAAPRRRRYCSFKYTLFLETLQTLANWVQVPLLSLIQHAQTPTYL
eukprot:1160894-Pelagomonas_calceolata.AAC.17